MAAGILNTLPNHRVFPNKGPRLQHPGGWLQTSLSAAFLAAALWLMLSSSAWARTATVERCIQGAARQYRIHPAVLRAVLSVESRLDPSARNLNTNGTVDLGIGQINSVHLPELSRMGIEERHLLDPCIGSYVAAWHLGRQLRRFGETWWGVGAYHSTTPQRNQRYQVLVYNEMVRTGALRGQPRPVPPLAP